MEEPQRILLRRDEDADWIRLMRSFERGRGELQRSQQRRTAIEKARAQDELIETQREFDRLKAQQQDRILEMEREKNRTEQQRLADKQRESLAAYNAQKKQQQEVAAAKDFALEAKLLKRQVKQKTRSPTRKSEKSSSPRSPERRANTSLDGLMKSQISAQFSFSSNSSPRAFKTQQQVEIELAASREQEREVREKRKLQNIAVCNEQLAKMKELEELKLKKAIDAGNKKERLLAQQYYDEKLRHMALVEKHRVEMILRSEHRKRSQTASPSIESQLSFDYDHAALTKTTMEEALELEVKRRKELMKVIDQRASNERKSYVKVHEEDILERQRVEQRAQHELELQKERERVVHEKQKVNVEKFRKQQEAQLRQRDAAHERELEAMKAALAAEEKDQAEFRQKWRHVHSLQRMDTKTRRELRQSEILQQALQLKVQLINESQAVGESRQKSAAEFQRESERQHQNKLRAKELMRKKEYEDRVEAERLALLALEQRAEAKRLVEEERMQSIVEKDVDQRRHAMDRVAFLAKQERDREAAERDNALLYDTASAERKQKKPRVPILSTLPPQKSEHVKIPPQPELQEYRDYASQFERTLENELKLADRRSKLLLS